MFTMLSSPCPRHCAVVIIIIIIIIFTIFTFILIGGPQLPTPVSSIPTQTSARANHKALASQLAHSYFVC